MFPRRLVATTSRFFRQPPWRDLSGSTLRPEVSSQLKTEVFRFDPDIPVEKAHTPPSSWFIQDAFQDLDKRLFKTNWIAVGRVDQVSKPGDFFSGSLCSEPYLVVRDDQSQLRAFFNVCRHHAAQVTPIGSEGCANKFTCPYHGWTYALDGRLTRAEKLKGIQDFKAKKFGLKPIRVQSWGPWIFLCLSAEADSDLAAKFRPVMDALNCKDHSSTTDSSLSGLSFVKRVRYHVDSNWKVFVDNYLDGGYHVGHLHKDLSSTLELDSYGSDVGQWYSLQKAKGTGQDERIGKRAVYAYMFPNFMVNRYGPWMDTNSVIPTGLNTCDVIYDYYLETSFMQTMSSSQLSAYVTQSLSSSDQVQQEDNAICRAVQAGLESSGYDQGRYAPRVEKADHSFHTQLARQYRNLIENN